MASNSRLPVDPARARVRRLLTDDPTLPRTLIELVLTTGDAGSGRPQRRAGDGVRVERMHRALPHRLPSAIAVEMPPNILYRRYPLVTSLLVELDELRRVGAVRPTRRGR